MAANKQGFAIQIDILPCPLCGKTDVETKRDELAGKVFLRCLSCSMESKRYKTLTQAIRSWNKASIHAERTRA